MNQSAHTCPRQNKSCTAASQPPVDLNVAALPHSSDLHLPTHEDWFDSQKLFNFPGVRQVHSTWLQCPKSCRKISDVSLYCSRGTPYLRREWRCPQWRPDTWIAFIDASREGVWNWECSSDVVVPKCEFTSFLTTERRTGSSVFEWRNSKSDPEGPSILRCIAIHRELSGRNANHFNGNSFAQFGLNANSWPVRMGQ